MTFPTPTTDIKFADLANLKERSNTAFLRILKTVDTQLDAAEVTFKSRLDDIKPDIDKHFEGVKITTVIRGPALSTSINDAIAKADILISDGLREANFGANKAVENIQFDYQSGVQLTLNEFNNGLKLITDWTDDKTKAVEAITTTLTADISQMHTLFGEKISKKMEALSDIVGKKTAELSEHVTIWSRNRPIIHLTGFVQLPPSLVKGANNKFRIGVRNEGNKQWNGWLGIRLVQEDEEGTIIGSWDSNPRPGVTPTVLPDTSQVFAIDVRVPNEVNAGDEIELFLLVNTI